MVVLLGWWFFGAGVWVGVVWVEWRAGLCAGSAPGVGGVSCEDYYNLKLDISCGLGITDRLIAVRVRCSFVFLNILM